jgi:eukaryotic-like serine/threonine-protein kinase
MLAPDTRLKDRYRILDKIGGGGFGHVYKAIDEAFGCCVAIKETKEEVASLDKLRKAFEREAKLLRSLKHDCLPRVTDYFFHDQAQFLVMDFIDGEDLGVLLKKRSPDQGPFSFREALPWAERILAALEYLHSRPEPIIHRDIKPSNIKLTTDGEVYLLDFGLAKGAAGQMSTVREGESSFSLAAFTHEYAPLEQMQDTGTQPQSDIYALGATLYHLLTGQFPVTASKRDEAIQRGQGDPLRLAHEVIPSIPVCVSKIISQAMTIRWWDRTGSVREMREGLASAWGEIVVTQPLDGPKREDNFPSAPATERITILPNPQQQDAASLSSGGPTIPTQTALKSNSLRRPWLIGGLALALLIAVAIGVSFAFPHWFPTTISTTENPKSLLSTTAELHLKLPLIGHKGTVWSVAFSPDGSLAASGGDDQKVILWDTNTWKPKFPPLVGDESPVYSLSFSSDGSTLATAGRDRMIRLWNTQTGKFTKAIQENTKLIFSVAFSPKNAVGNVLASISGEDPLAGGDEIRLWYERTKWQSKVLAFNSMEDKTYAMAFSPDGNTFATAGYGNQIHLWDVNNGERIRDLYIKQPSGNFVSRLIFSADGKYLAVASGDGSIKLWRTEKWQGPEELSKEHTSVITAMAFSPDNITLISASSDKTIRLWNVETKTSKLLASSDNVCQSLTFSTDGQTLLSGGEDQIIRVWQLQAGR